MANLRAFVAQTEEGAEEIRAALPGSTTYVLPTPVADLPWYPLNGDPRALFTGRFSEEKDLPTLIAVWDDISEQLDSVVLTLAGDGGEFRSVEADVRRQITAMGMTATVNLVGWVEDVTPLLQSHDVFVFPSLSEGMSNSLVEACAAGRVVVCSDIPPNRSVVGDDYPLLYRAGDAAEMKHRLMIALLDEQVRAAARSRLRARMERHLLSRVLEELEGMVEK